MIAKKEQLIKDCYPKYTKNSYNSTSSGEKKRKNTIKKWTEDLKKIVSKKTYRWPTGA